MYQVCKFSVNTLTSFLQLPASSNLPDTHALVRHYRIPSSKTPAAGKHKEPGFTPTSEPPRTPALNREEQQTRGADLTCSDGDDVAAVHVSRGKCCGKENLLVPLSYYTFHVHLGPSTWPFLTWWVNYFDHNHLGAEAGTGWPERAGGFQETCLVPLQPATATANFL